MTTEQQTALVRKWFEQAEEADGPLLPDGWFGGRRGEAGGSLQDVHTVGNTLVVSLSEDTTLRFDGPCRVLVENDKWNSWLVFDGYELATLRWKHYGGGPDAPYYEKRYASGQVRLAAPLGTMVKIE